MTKHTHSNVSNIFFLQLVYDVSKLIALSEELENVVDSRKFSEAYEVFSESVIVI